MGFLLSAFIHVLLSKAFPPVGLGETDEEDVYGTFNEIVEKSSPAEGRSLEEGWEVEKDEKVPA